MPQSMITLWIRHDERQSNGKPDAAGIFMRCVPFAFGMEHVNRSNLMEVLVAYFLCIRACIKSVCMDDIRQYALYEVDSGKVLTLPL